MEEQLITFETAKLAKEKGFFYGVSFYSITNVYNDAGYLIEVKDTLIGEEDILAPTQSLLQKWLREEKSIFVMVTMLVGDKFRFEIYSQYFNPVFNDDITGSDYEEALEKGLQEALKLIKND